MASKVTTNSLEAAATRAEALAADLTAEVGRLEAEEARVKDQVAAAIAAGGEGKPIRPLADQRDALQLKLLSRRQDAAAAVDAARKARAVADRVRLEADSRAIGAELATSDATLEALLGQLADAWQARLAGPAARALALNAEIAAFEREHRREHETIAAPAEALTEAAYTLCAEAGPELATLAQLREELAHPRPPVTFAPPAFFIAGTSPRALRSRLRAAWGGILGRSA